MEKIHHRINTIKQLEQVPLSDGVELDIRYHENRLVLHHDPFHHHEPEYPEEFETFLRHWKHRGVMILNIKTEGVELECIRLMNQYQIKKWFFLDLSMPYFALFAEKAANKEIEGFGIEHLAVRYSEREALEYALGFAGKARWVWVDCFTKMPLNQQTAKRLKQFGFKLCLVSPELQQHDVGFITDYQEQLKKECIIIDAICSKKPHLWY